MALIVACKGYAEGVSLYDQAHSRTPNRSMNGGLNGSSVFSDYRGAGSTWLMTFRQSVFLTIPSRVLYHRSVANLTVFWHCVPRL